MRQTSMPRDLDGFAKVVALAIRAEMAPLQERLSAVEARISRVTEAEKALMELRDRVVAVEVKAAVPLPVVELPDLTPLSERLAATEAVLSRHDVSEQAIAARLVAVETKAATPAPAVLETQAGPSAAELELSVRDKLEPLTKQLADLSQRLAVAETRAPMPGPPGKDGRDGLDGKDGADGFGLEDFSADFDGDRTLALKFERGELKKSSLLRLPFMRQQGVYLEGKSYVHGDVVTWAGSQWHCNEDTTTRPGEGSKAWTLIVKRGRDGKDGRDAVGALPVVSVGGSR